MPCSEDGPYPPVGREEIERLKQALVTFVQTHPHDQNLVSAVHALYYLAAADTKPLLVQILRDSLGRDPRALFQTILALEALGESFYEPGTTSRSIDKVELNEAVARGYLAGGDGEQR